MRFATYRVGEQERSRVGIVLEDTVRELATGQLSDLLTASPATMEGLVAAAGPEQPLADVQLVAPLVPRKLICIGTNYAAHADEVALERPKVPLVFAKYSSAIVGNEDPIVLPAASAEVDYEAELAVVIGKRARDVPRDRALEHVFGYTAFNDVSARDLQFSEGGQWIRSKSFDTFAPLGPWVVTADEIPDPQVLSIRCSVSGEMLQDGNTADMIFGVAELIAFLSVGTTLEPGDVIATGTPPGVGMARDPQRFLRPGDDVVVEVEGVGSLRNAVVSA